MREQLEVLVEDIADRLQHEAKTSTGNYETYYTAAKLLRAFNDIFAPTWSDVQLAEQMRIDREADRRAGVPWIGDTLQ
jgi:hypothetical protein